jgi:hypothetical protein
LNIGVQEKSIQVFPAGPGHHLPPTGHSFERGGVVRLVDDGQDAPVPPRRQMLHRQPAHPAIIDPDLWGRVHERLGQDAHARGAETRIRSRSDALLRGLLYAPSGERMYPTYTRKNGRKYHYYVARSEVQFGAPGKRYDRLPAAEIEAAVVAQIRTVLTSPESIAAVVRHIQRNGDQIDEAATVLAMGRLNDGWDQLFPVERHRIANLMIERIDIVHAGELQGIKVKWRELGWDALIGEFAPRGIGAEMLDLEAA